MEQNDCSTPPFLDHQLEYVSVAKLRRRFSLRDIRGLSRPVVITSSRESRPLAVMIPYSTYMKMQDLMIRGLGPILDRLIETAAVATWTSSEDQENTATHRSER